VSWINVDEATFYGVAWCLGFISSTLTMARDRRRYRKSFSECIVIGAVGGFLSCSCVGVLVGGLDGPVTHHWYYLSLAILIGLSARQADQIRATMLERVMSYKLVLDPKRKKRQEDEEDCLTPE